jgi:hypothetical protein
MLFMESDNIIVKRVVLAMVFLILLGGIITYVLGLIGAIGLPVA